MSNTHTTSPRAGRRFAIALASVFALIASLAAPAGAQSAQREQEQLEAQAAALESQIADIEEALIEFEAERSQVLVDIDTATAAIEGSGDALERLALDRREPARARLNLALERFVSGDPAQDAITQALITAEQDPATFQNREVFGSIAEAAEAEIARIDAESQVLQATIPDLQVQRTALAERLITIDALVRGLRIDQDEAQGELELVDDALAWFRNAANRSVITGRAIANPNINNTPALVVKIDNVPRARPQTAINDADIVYVELVEGGVTRYAAVFHSENPGTVGPVRSMRTTDINLLRPLNEPLFANSGANQITTAAVNASQLVNIGAATGAGGAYFRNGGRPAPHNLFSTTQALRSAGGNRGGVPPVVFAPRRPGTDLPNAAAASNGFRVNYPNTSVLYDWNGTGWARTQDGAATVDTAGVRTAPETVIVQFTPYGPSRADANSPEAQVVGTGDAWIFTEGQLIRGTWSKSRPLAVTQYRDANGDLIELLPGRIWVELPKPGGARLR